MEITVKNTDYLIVQISNPDYEDLHNKNVIVPYNYLISVPGVTKYKVRYLNPQYGEEDMQLIKDFIQANVQAN